jgi:hypothetical protein
MAFDPMSVLGVVGTTAGLLSFLTSTIENISIRLRDYQECVKKLQEYRHTVEDAVLGLQIWFSLWSRTQAGRCTPYESGTYALFWGESGLNQMSERLELIQYEIRAITELLECRKIRDANIDWKELGRDMRCPSEYEIKDWYQILYRESRQRHISSPSEMDRLYRFLFAIYRNVELKSRISNLRDRISELQKTSVALYRKNHEIRGGDPSSEDLQQTAALQEERSCLLNFLDELYHDNNLSKIRWNLILGNPSLQRALSRLRGKSKIQLEFRFKNHEAEGVCEFKIPYPKYRNLQRWEIMEKVNKNHLDLSATQAADPSGRKRHRSSCHERLELHTLTPLSLEEVSTNMSAAVAMAQSTILLYKSLWIDGLCFCGITLYDDHGNNKTIAYVRRKDCRHVPDLFRQDAFLLLATFLAEIAFGAPIQIHLSEAVIEEPSFEVPEEILLPNFNGRMNWETLSELLSERMDEIPQHFASHDYLEAMEYCYSLSQRLKTRDFVNDDLDICIARIETP